MNSALKVDIHSMKHISGSILNTMQQDDDNAPSLGLGLLYKSPTISPYQPHVGVVGHTIDRCIRLTILKGDKLVISLS